MNPAGPERVANLRKLIALGFERFTLNYWHSFNGVDPARLAEEVRPVAEAGKVKISAVSLFGNPLPENEEGEVARESIAHLIDCAPLFGCDIVSGFTCRLPDVPIPENIARFKEVRHPWRSVPPRKTSASPGKIVRCTGIGIAAAGILPTIPTPGS